MNTAPDLQAQTLGQLAQLIIIDWEKPYFGATPYIGAMAQLRLITDRYGADDARMVVAYFLANAGSWRGPTARAVKAELKRRLGR